VIAGRPDRLVAIDARGYFTGGGIGRYTRNLVRGLVSARPAGTILRLLISNRHAPCDLELADDVNVEIVVSRATWLEAEEEERWLGEEIADADLFHSLSGHWVPERPASVATLLDLTPLVQPELFADEGRHFEGIVTRAMSRAAHVIAISRSTAHDAHRLMDGVPPISVVHLAADDVFQPSAPDEELLDRFDVAPDGFILAVSVLNPHKNLVRLIDAYAQSGVFTPLLIVGAQREATALVEQAIEKHRLGARVHLVGRVADAELASLYSSCRTFMYPSLYEGFGLPVIEAMACGAAVIASETSSIPEVAGDAAWLVDPIETSSLAFALRTIDRDAAIRNDLRRRGLERAKTFSWASTVSQTLAVYDDVLEARAA
jgi:glycosyltransferase involved in cell wall biosynthesis